MTNPITLSIAAQLAEYARAWVSAWQANPESGFSHWATWRAGISVPFELPAQDGLLVLGEQRWREAPVLATAGYELACGRTTLGEHWLSGAGRLTKREALPADRQSFFYRPLELLGIAVGAAALRERDPSIADWLCRLLGEGADRLPHDLVTRVSVTLVRQVLGQPAPWKPVHDAPAWPDLATLIWAAAAFPEIPWLADPLARHDDTLLRAYVIDGPRPTDAAEAALAWTSLRLAAARRIDITIATVGAAQTADRLVTLLRRFHLMVLTLRERYAGRPGLSVNDEHDVQDLLRAMLVLHFDDVQPEYWTPSYGGVQARSDFLLRPERTMVETKMTRQRLEQKEIVEELMIDREHYSSDKRCDRLVCMVYDPDHRLKNPVAIEKDLSTAVPISTVVIVVPRGT